MCFVCVSLFRWNIYRQWSPVFCQQENSFSWLSILCLNSVHIASMATALLVLKVDYCWHSRQETKLNSTYSNRMSAVCLHLLSLLIQRSPLWYVICVTATHTASQKNRHFILVINSTNVHQFLGNRLCKNSSGDEIANVNFFTTTSYM